MSTRNELAVILQTQRARIDDANEGNGGPSAVANAAPAQFDDDERWGGHALPRDHPAWPRDAISLSQRARAHLATLPRALECAVAQWFRRTRATALVLTGGDFARSLHVDTSGFYRLGW